jgi:hypothetical protein
LAFWLVDHAFHVPPPERGGASEVGQLFGAGLCVVVAVWVARARRPGD